ncbi:MAG: DUF6508 domain-containing protein [Thermoanaerobaculia bacterium]|nr:DUF6508 domain-containing protein [Thermoanaerobaculia bacterium]
MNNPDFSQPLPLEENLSWAVGFVERLDEAAGKEIWRGGKAEGNQFPWCQLPSVVDEFLLGCGTRGLMRRDYDAAILGKLAEGSVQLESLDLLDTLRVLTAHIRADRFCEGHLASALRSGEFQEVLRRLGRLIEGGADTAE